jgi:hypothetical protein
MRSTTEDAAIAMKTRSETGAELCTANGRKDYDWAHLAAHYFPKRVDEKCQKDPSLGVAHHCFWRYHPAKAYAWELRLQDEIKPNFAIDEAPGSDPLGTSEGSDVYRQAFLDQHPDQARETEAKEQRRERNQKTEEKSADQTAPRSTFTLAN